MGVKEYRVGNLVNEFIGIGDNGVEYRLVEICGIEPSFDYVWLNYANGSGVYKRHIDNVEPIPITGEWLLRFGFDKSEYVGYFTPCAKYMIDWDDINSFILYKDYGTKDVKIQYVHQLQNLYYALTGKELERKNQG